MTDAGLKHRMVLLIALLCIVASTPSVAQTCDADITNIDFGEIDVTANVAFPITGTYSVSCDNILLAAVRTCPNINAGTGGASPSGDQRYMLSGANQLRYNLYSDPSYATVWGSRTWTNTAPPTDITLVVLGSGNTSRPIYARIPAGQQTLPPGAYTSSFSGGGTNVTYAAYLLSLPPFAPNCATHASPSITAPFTVSATIIPNCSVSATLLDFGTAGILQSDIDSTNTLSVTCTATTPYSVSLNGGLTGASDPTQRQMTRPGGSITYGLYRDAGFNQPWGDSIGSNTLAGVGSGLAQIYTVHGRVPPQPTPGPGTYSDTVVVTVTY